MNIWKKFTTAASTSYRFFVGYRMRRNYWSNSRFSYKIQQLFGMKEHPKSATSEEWDELNSHNKNINRVIFWITETGFDIAQDIVYFIPDVYKNIRVYIVNRFVDKTHIIETKLSKGKWHEVETVLLHGIMETVVAFVEKQKATMQDICFEEERIKNRREAGLKYLDWEISLGDENFGQAQTATIVKEIYLWWKDERPKRPDIHDVTGWSEYCCSHEPLHMNQRSEEEKQQVKEMLDDITFLETFYDNEDYEMMKKAIEWRRGMWT